MAWRQPQQRRMRSRVRCAALLIVFAFGTAVLTGCGPSSDRLQISGEVTLDGSPLDGASIRFTSLGETPIASGAMIDNGEYTIPQEKGLPPGTYHVEISAPDTAAPPVMARASPGGPGIPVAPERVPPEYNTKSKQSIEVTPDGDNHFMFEIVTRPTK